MFILCTKFKAYCATRAFTKNDGDFVRGAWLGYDTKNCFSESSEFLFRFSISSVCLLYPMISISLFRSFNALRSKCHAGGGGGIDFWPPCPPMHIHICLGHLFSYGRYHPERANIRVSNHKYIMISTMRTKTESDKVIGNIGERRDGITR